MATDAISAELHTYLGLKIGMTSGIQAFSPVDSSGTVSDQQVQQAAGQLQAHFAQRSAPPELSFDYLSGLSVVTVRAADSGELLYQMPGIEAVRLARLIASGAASGVLDTKV